RRQQILADVAHELRSPVATLKTMAEALRDGVAESPERRHRALTVMVDTSDRMEHLLRDLLELARLDMHELPIQSTSVDMAGIAEDCVLRHAAAAERARIRLLPVEASGPAMVEGDSHRLAQVLDNLLDNALSYAGAEALVTVRVLKGLEAVTVEVADTGRGIAAKHLPFLFDPFYRVDAVRTPGDHHSGLGLRIAAGLVRAHGGTLSIESEEGAGTTASVVLPAIQGASPPRDDAAQKPIGSCAA
ncbi:MAG TPA: HAMP domain-containing sensor histidine kinase, partial [Tepidisphaeraceae bacterium]